MSVIYNAKILLKSGYGNPGTVLDVAEAGYDISANKLYIGTGIGNVPDGIIMDPSYNQLYQMVIDIESSVGGSATLPYVDGSLNNIRSTYIPDSSLSNDFIWNNNLLEVSLGAVAGLDKFATNASVGNALAKYIPDASLGSDFYWQGGLLEVSIGSILSVGKNLIFDTSGNIAVTNSPNFSGDVSIQSNLFLNQKLNLTNYTLPSPIAGDIWWQQPRLLFRDGLNVRDILQGSLKGTVYPVSPSEGDLFYRTDNGNIFVYDGSRGKYLSISRNTLNGGRTTAVAGSTVYIRIGDATQSSTAGYKMIRNGTITGFSIDNNNTLTAPRIVQIRINDVSALTRTIEIGQKGFSFGHGNVDFVENDVLQIAALPGVAGSALNNWIAVIEYATRS